MLLLQLTEPPALAGDCQWLVLCPCKLGPCQPQLHLCKFLHWQPCCTGPLDTCSLQRKHFYKELPYHAPPRQEADLLNLPVILTDNHIKMMDALCHLDSYGLQFICESVEALRTERTPTQAPPGYHTPQASDIPWGSTNNPLLSQEFYRATSNLGTAIVEPQQVLPQQRLAENCCPDPEIESAIANMHRHEQASGMPSMDSNNNPW